MPDHALAAIEKNSAAIPRVVERGFTYLVQYPAVHRRAGDIAVCIFCRSKESSA
jgi:hypothetical protein